MSGGDHSIRECGCVLWDDGEPSYCDRHKPPPDHDAWLRLRNMSIHTLRELLANRRRAA